MSYFYTIVQRTHPKTKKKQFYAQAISAGLISVNDIALRIAHRSGHSVGQVIGLLNDYLKLCSDYLQQGKNVRMGKIGIITPTFRCKGSDTEKDLTADNIKRIKLNLRTSPSVRQRMSVKRLGLKRYVIKTIQKQ